MCRNYNVLFFIAGFRGHIDQKHLEAFFGQFGQIKKLVYDHRRNFAIVQFCERYVLKEQLILAVLLVRWAVFVWLPLLTWFYCVLDNLP
jgi:hypothetical protein